VFYGDWVALAWWQQKAKDSVGEILSKEDLKGKKKGFLWSRGRMGVCCWCL